MQFTLSFTFILALAAMVTAGPVAMPKDTDENSRSSGVTSSVISEAELDHWLQTTNANLTFTGQSGKNPLRRDGQVRVVHCTNRQGPVCGGNCDVFEGTNTCIEASGTNCIMATANVAFCDRGGCGGSCNFIDSCGTRLDNNFCATPGTKSILVPFI
ncbi:hypothetical protein CCMSSC00406_0004902 [Pleurotus cornucopiae]|uniref:Uncharacterized protein n=1 Tax=Pleurotus cornucopiae TaxID=5321 RepID=A0ACB7J008_PLECO|nr:hypothetical protein CCMSSC00406_0004902 [Pleurotus cornucopiae]